MPIKAGDWLVEDKLWRLRNLYKVKRADTGQLVPFVPRPEQELVYKELLGGRKRLIILKARRLGVSTAIDIYAQDEVVFREGFQCSIVDRNEAEASPQAQQHRQGRLPEPAGGDAPADPDPEDQRQRLRAGRRQGRHLGDLRREGTPAAAPTNSSTSPNGE